MSPSHSPPRCLATAPLLLGIVILARLCATYHCVILAPRFHTLTVDNEPVHNKFFDDDDDNDPSKFEVRLSESSSQEIGLNSAGIITVSLNLPLEQKLIVDVTVASGKKLISLKNNANATSDDKCAVVYLPGSFADRQVNFRTALSAGHVEIRASVSQPPSDIKIDTSKAYASINIAKSSVVTSLIGIVGWIYLLAWSVSFYFQVQLNYARKSVVGLNFDFLALNLVGFTAYAIYNLLLYYSRTAQLDYYSRYSYSRIPVEYHDILFSLHALGITLVTIAQCFFYERGQQKVSIFTIVFVALSCSISLVLYVCHLFTWIKLLDVALFVSYVKLAITLIKYAPQAYMNYSNKSTEGWSISNILLDITGGTFSILQMFLLSYNYDDWISIFGNFTKFGLGLFSICFDVLFISQHYIFYRNNSINSANSSTDRMATDYGSFDQSERGSDEGVEEEERQRRLQASSGAIQSGSYINEDLIA